MESQAPGGGAWSSDLFDCCNDSHSCCLTCWCGCVAIGRIAEIVDKGSSSCMGAGCIYALLSIMTCQRMYSRRYRTKMREQFGIPGSKAGDCFTNYFCECCSITQMYRELTARGYDVSLGWEGNLKKRNQGVNMAPVAPGGMYR